MADLKTPDTRNKRPIAATTSPSDDTTGGHVNSPNPIRRKASLPDLSTLSGVNISDTSVSNINANVTDLVKKAICTENVLQAVVTAIGPAIQDILSSTIKPLTDTIEQQTSLIKDMSSKFNTQSATINDLKTENNALKLQLKTTNEKLNETERKLDKNCFEKKSFKVRICVLCSFVIYYE